MDLLVLFALPIPFLALYCRRTGRQRLILGVRHHQPFPVRLAQNTTAFHFLVLAVRVRGQKDLERCLGPEVLDPQQRGSGRGLHVALPELVRGRQEEHPNRHNVGAVFQHCGGSELTIEDRVSHVTDRSTGITRRQLANFVMFVDTDTDTDTDAVKEGLWERKGRKEGKTAKTSPE